MNVFRASQTFQGRLMHGRPRRRDTHTIGAACELEKIENCGVFLSAREILWWGINIKIKGARILRK